MIANVEYEISYSEGAEEWLTNYTVQENVHKWNCLAWEGEGLRKATISFTEKNPADTENPLKVSVVVSQSNFLIDVVADMDDHRAWIVDDAPNMDVFKLGQTLTLEALVKFQGDFYWDEDGQRVGAIAGIERRFLIRHSDAYGGAWELVYGLTRTNYNGEHYEGKVQSWKDLPENEWVHLAVTVGEGKIVLYQNGENVGEGDVPGDFKPVDFGEIYNAPNNGQTQRFSLGYAYEGNRDFDGLMSEVRIWNRALGEDEIKASNHFYSVPANSEGLVAYWKLDDGEGDIVKDYTSNGNNLKGYVKNGGPNNNPNWEEGMTWVEVGLPETRN